MSDFSLYTDAILSAYKFSATRADVVSKKKEWVDTVFSHHQFVPQTVLFVGFTPAVFALPDAKISVTEMSQAAIDFIRESGVSIDVVSDLFKHEEKFDCVITSDEYFTFAQSLEEQVQKISTVCSAAKTLVVTTLKDYKNLDFKEREFSVPAVIRDGNSSMQFLEFHNPTHRNMWETTVSQITNSTLTSYGPFPRAIVYFKQLAKFSIDAGAKTFLVHKNLMNKSMLRKSYDHIISIKL